MNLLSSYDRYHIPCRIDRNDRLNSIHMTRAYQYHKALMAVSVPPKALYITPVWKIQESQPWTPTESKTRNSSQLSRLSLSR